MNIVDSCGWIDTKLHIDTSFIDHTLKEKYFMVRFLG